MDVESDIFFHIAYLSEQIIGKESHVGQGLGSVPQLLIGWRYIWMWVVNS